MSKDTSPINLHNIAKRGADIAEAHGRLADKRAAQVDRSTFNYGRALGAPKDNAEFVAIETVAQALGQINMQLSAAHWRLDMALKNVRDAETATEQAAYLAVLRETFHHVDRKLETVASGPVKFYRYGRIGNVLRSFNPFGRS